MSLYQDGIATIAAPPTAPPKPAEGVGAGTVAALIIGGSIAIGVGQGIFSGYRKAHPKPPPIVFYDHRGRPL